MNFNVPRKPVRAEDRLAREIRLMVNTGRHHSTLNRTDLQYLNGLVQEALDDAMVEISTEQRARNAGVGA